MATLSINIPDAIAQRVVDGFCKRNGYVAVLDNGTPNPVTKNQFFKQGVITYIKQCVREAEVSDAQVTAMDNAANSVETDITMT